MQHRRRPRSTVTRVAALAVLATSIAGWSAGRSGAEAGTCAQPYPATFAAVTYPAPPEPVPWEGGRELDHVPGIVDTDGDGTADTITDLPENAVRITRSSGSFTFPAHTFVTSRFDPADLDGDGRTDLVASIPVAGGNAVFVVPGTVADGPLDPAAEAVRVPDPVAGARPVGDQDGDGVVDVATSSEADGSGDTLLFSGVALTAPGPGGTADEEPLRRLDGVLVGRIPFAAGPPTLVTASGDELVVHDEPAVRLTVAGSGIELPYPTAGTTSAKGVVDGDATWLVLGYGDRSGNKVWAWNLTDPCGSAAGSPPTAPGSAPAATPVDGAASYTG